MRATSTGTYVVDVLKSDGTEVHVLLDAKFAVTSVEEGGMGGRGGPPPSGAGTGSGTGSSDPSDANGTSSTDLTPRGSRSRSRDALTDPPADQRVVGPRRVPHVAVPGAAGRTRFVGSLVRLGRVGA